MVGSGFGPGRGMHLFGDPGRCGLRQEHHPAALHGIT
jgi:hypothetical protein